MEERPIKNCLTEIFVSMIPGRGILSKTLNLLFILVRTSKVVISKTRDTKAPISEPESELASAKSNTRVHLVLYMAYGNFQLYIWNLAPNTGRAARSI